MMKVFLFEFEDKRYIYVGELLVSFETNVEIVEFSSEPSLNDIKYQLAYSDENF